MERGRPVFESAKERGDLSAKAKAPFPERSGPQGSYEVVAERHAPPFHKRRHAAHGDEGNAQVPWT